MAGNETKREIVLKHLFIINPVAGGKKNDQEAVRHEIEAFAQSLDAPSEIYVTKAPLDATRKIAQYAQTEEMLYVYACGGDGTLNECVNGAALHKHIAVTQYAIGTGNDFIKSFGEENADKFRDLSALSAGMVKPIDLIDCNGKYGINICSVGIDARVSKDVHKYSRIPIIGGATGYVVALIANVIKGVSHKFKVTAGGKMEETTVTLICACNGCFYGGGFNPVPEAVIDDGYLEFLIVKSVSRFKLAKIVKKYANGKYKELPELITHIKGSSMEIESDIEFVVNIDGEAIHENKISFNIVPQGINFILPEGL